MTTTGQRVTAEELLAMPNDEPCELIAGEVVKLPFAELQHGMVVGKVFMLVASHVRGNGLGSVLAGSAGFVIARDPDTVRAADVTFIRRDRQHLISEGYFPGPPDLAIEVISRFDRVGNVEDKALAWLDAGTAMVWVVWPKTRSVTVHRAGQPPRILHEQDAITGEDVLPGFQCSVAEFFRD